MADAQSKIAVLGAGAWGTALALQLANNCHEVMLWGRDQPIVDEINNQHTTPFLPQVALPVNLLASSDLSDVLTGCDYLLIAVPSGAFAEVCDKAAKLINLSGTPVAWATKGIDPKTGMLLSQLLAEKYDVKQMALVSGPSFALEVGLQKPTAVNIVSEQSDFQLRLSKDFTHPYLRIYCSNDLIGSQVCAIYKNVLAIAAGACDGMDMGLNARAALLTRGLEEMRRLVVAMGGKEKTVYGLCGLGDLLLTATGDLSRNRQLGLALSKYSTIAEAAAAVGKTIEGQANIYWLLSHARALGVELPICEIVGKVLQEAITIQDALGVLMGRVSSRS
jgi:glycerol-3-phosphate dehydrogenase (NAD(P)+)